MDEDEDEEEVVVEKGGSTSIRSDARERRRGSRKFRRPLSEAGKGRAIWLTVCQISGGQSIPAVHVAGTDGPDLRDNNDLSPRAPP
uniref:Uncharacterized protein n=1 Tax=Oryza brachyantha TaxID=4533 RepID=J3L3E3_ORYBR